MFRPANLYESHWTFTFAFLFCSGWRCFRNENTTHGTTQSRWDWHKSNAHRIGAEKSDMPFRWHAKSRRWRKINSTEYYYCAVHFVSNNLCSVLRMHYALCVRTFCTWVDTKVIRCQNNNNNNRGKSCSEHSILRRECIILLADGGYSLNTYNARCGVLA